MSQNLLLDYRGGTPQKALTGQYQRDWWSVEPSTVESITGSTEQRPDTAERMMRQRLLANQCVLQGIIEDRLAQADRMRQHRHPPELLLPGAVVDIWRKPDRKDQDGWKRPGGVDQRGTHRRERDCSTPRDAIYCSFDPFAPARALAVFRLTRASGVIHQSFRR